ncbi:MAG: LUD domain-containing protein [Bacteroidales bacterium]|jgi:L-lactate dehydrogenase complex protein LldG|nr:LUD domain-containing protein [Bacteroidales bacterium]
MEESTTKEKILKSVRNALINKTDNPFKNTDFTTRVFNPQEEGPDVEFALKFNEGGGTFIYCDNEKNFTDNLKTLMVQKGWEQVASSNPALNNLLSTAGIDARPPESKLGFEVSITGCDFLISRFGSILVSSKVAERNLFVGANTHLIVAKSSQVKSEIKEALSALKIKYSGSLPSQITMITGAENTTSFTRSLPAGAIGSKNLFVFMIDDA